MSSQQGVNVFQLPLEQLEGVKQQLDSDISTLGTAYDGLFNGRTRYLENCDAIEQYRQVCEDLKTVQNGGNVPVPEKQDVLVCMTSSLFVKGTVIPSDKVLVDVGTGYFLEKSMEHAKSYFNSRAAQIKESMDSIEKTILVKQKQQNQVVNAMEQKARAMQQYQEQHPNA
ncbi:unnamed protein product [Phytomonas sp. EM1]|nr:unnamed protein product [Phytomonas sp. EM1]|eukprot:CCW65560.1 unnamed protein product [Phytomonas sp. isolate EM1]